MENYTNTIERKSDDTVYKNSVKPRKKRVVKKPLNKKKS
jgi:hypothetical protein